MYSKVLVQGYPFFSAVPASKGDIVVVHCKYGLLQGPVTEVLESGITDNPWEKRVGAKGGVYVRAKCPGVVENITTGQTKEVIHMLGFKVVKVKVVGESDKFVYSELALQPSDIVIIDETDSLSADMHFGTLKIGQVVEVDMPNKVAFGYVISKANLSSRLERRTFVKQSQETRRKLDAKVREFQELELLRLIAANDPETAELLKQYTTQQSFGGTEV